MTSPPRAYMDPPKVEPYRFGLLGAAQPVAPDGHWRIGGVEWESLASYQAATYTAGVFYLGDQGGNRATKVLSDSMPVGTAWPFAVYGGVECGSIGRPAEEFLERSREVLALARPRAVEAELWTGGGQQRVTRLNQDFGGTANTIVTGTQAAPTAVSLTRAFGLLEQWLGSKYNGVGMIHAQRELAPLAGRQHVIHRDPANSEALITDLGTRCVFGGGYDGSGPGATAPTATQRWIYATGQIFIAADEPGPDLNFADVLTRGSNREFALVEQMHMLGIDGPWAAALVDLTL